MGQLKCPVNSVMYAVSYKRLSFSPFRPVHLTWLGHSCEVCRLRSGWRQKVVKMWKWIPGIATAFARTDLRNCRHFELLMIVRVQDLCHFNELVYTPQPSATWIPSAFTLWLVMTSSWRCWQTNLSAPAVSGWSWLGCNYLNIRLRK